MLRKGHVFAIALTFFLSSICLGSELAAEKRQSRIAQILKSSGKLYLRESHALPEIFSLSGPIVECSIVLARNLLEQNPIENEVAIGLVLKTTGTYGDNSTHIDIDEVDGLIASLELMKREGADLLAKEIASHDRFLDKSGEVQFTTRDKVSIALIETRKGVAFLLRVSPAAEWSLLSKSGVETLLDNLKTAKAVAESLKK